jgi:hypothetical protein
VTTVAVIQPYFVPYAGYFRLFAAADLVVMFDCVQFPRRGWVHRNRFALASGEQDWLTLPIAKCDRDTRICDLEFAPGAGERIARAMHRFPLLERALRASNPLLERTLHVGDADFTNYLCDLVSETALALSMLRPMIRSSTLPIDPSLRAQDRVIAIVKAVGGTHYVNPSGGRELYDHDSFANAGLELRFLTPYGGSYDSILARRLSEPADAIAAEIARESVLLA